MGIGSRLQILLHENNVTPIQLSKRIGVPEQTIYSLLKRDGSKVSIDVLLALCAEFGVSAEYFTEREITISGVSGLTPAAQRIGRAYEIADPPVQRTVEVALEPYMDKAAPIKKAPSKEDAEIAEEIAPSVIALRHYTETAAAGLGDYLASEDFEMVEYPEDIVPYGADYTVKISGDSMEPNIHDGDIAFVKECVEIPDGKIGIFIIDGHSYCKELHIDEDEGRIYLVSHNEKYADKAINPEFMDFRTVGRVLSTVTPE